MDAAPEKPLAPYRPLHEQSRPLSWRVVHPDFTNPDPRLHPRLIKTAMVKRHRGYVVDELTFPEVSKEFQVMSKRVGIPAHQLLITDSIPKHAATILKDERVILVNRTIWNNLGYEALLTMAVGHEIGHAWRHAHPTKPLLKAAAPIKTAKAYELESDLLALCAAGNVDGLVQWMKNYDHGPLAFSANPRYPTNQEITEASRQTRWRDCPVAAFEIPPPSTPPMAKETKRHIGHRQYP